ncbi:MAG: hypothetical protein B6D74_12205, partial [gamma proteobacterium symbiont of Ctena orbiculata]
MSEQLADLDELVLRCRNKIARSYIKEAVRSYKAGAYRAAIVTTWIAIVFDYLDKLRELEISGHKDAKKELEEFEKHRKANDVKKSLDFERELLDNAKDRYEFISPYEHLDLSRLMEDRHRSAHPSMNSVEEVYKPTAEMARLHIRNAITAMLQYPPVQGKAALDSIKKDLESDYFPTSSDEAQKVLKSGPLGMPRDSLVRNLTIVLVKRLLLEDLSDKPHAQTCAALNAVREMHPEMATDVLKEKLSSVAGSVSDDRYHVAVKFLALIPDTWQFLDDGVRAKTENYANTMEGDQVVNGFGYALRVQEISEQVEARIPELSDEELIEVSRTFSEELPEKLADRALERYANATSWNDANWLANKL